MASVNTIITKTISLFQSTERCPAWPLGDSLWRVALYGYVASSDGNSILRSHILQSLLKRQDSGLMMHTVMSYQMCHLLEVWNDAFDIMFWATPVCKVLASRAQPATHSPCRRGPEPRPLALTMGAAGPSGAERLQNKFYHWIYL